MKRIACRRQTQANSTYAEKDFVPDAQDKVTFDVVGGTISFVVPPDLADDQVLQANWIGRDAYCVLKLENRAELELWISDGPCTAVVRKPK